MSRPVSGDDGKVRLFQGSGENRASPALFKRVFAADLLLATVPCQPCLFSVPAGGAGSSPNVRTSSSAAVRRLRWRRWAHRSITSSFLPQPRESSEESNAEEAGDQRSEPREVTSSTVRHGGANRQ